LSDAEKDAEVIKKNKLLEAKEETLQMKAEVEKQANARLAKIQNVENRLKQREMQLNQRHEELNKKNTELDELKVNLDNQHELLEKKNRKSKNCIVSRLKSSRPFRAFQQPKPKKDWLNR